LAGKDSCETLDRGADIESLGSAAELQQSMNGSVMKSILLFAAAESASPDRGAARYAIELARAQGAALTVFVIALDVTTPGRSTDAAAVTQAVARAAGAANVACTAITAHSHAMGVTEVIAEHARLHDLVVTGCDANSLLSERTVAEHLLFEAGRPLLVVPADFQGPVATDRAIVAWDNSRFAARALADTLLLGVKTLTLLTIDGDKQVPGDLDAPAREALLVRRGLSVRHHSAPKAGRGIGEALQQEAQTAGADLLAAGGFGHARLRRFVLGSATSELLADLRVPVLFSH
jgi:nucleotide-binding universal stress UspA family protein